MAGQATHRHPDVKFALVGHDRLHAGRLSDHAKIRAQARLADILDQPSYAAATHFLVIGDEQMQRPDERQRLEIWHRRETSCNEALHVATSAREELAIRPPQRERIAGPCLTIGRYCIDMTAEREATRPRRTNDSMHVGS